MPMKKSQKNRSGRVSLKHRVILTVLTVLCVAGISAVDILLHKRLSDVIDKTVLGYRVGELATKDVAADETVYYIDTTATAKLQEAASQAVLPVFRISLTRSLDSLDTLDQIRTVMLEEIPTLEKVERINEAGLDTYFTGDSLQVVLSYEAQERAYLFSYIEEVLIQIYEKGICADAELAAADDPEVISLLQVSTSVDGGTIESEVPSGDLLTLDTLGGYLDRLFLQDQAHLGEFKDTALTMVTALAENNVIYDSITTERRRLSALQGIDPVMKTIEEGELILKEGFVITEDDYERIRALEQVAVSQSSYEIIGRILYYAASVLIAAWLLLKNIPHTHRRVQYLYMCLTFTIIYLGVCTLLIFQVFALEIEYVVFFLPVILFSMLLTIIINRNTSLIVTGLLAALSMAIPDIALIETLYILALGLIGSYIIQNARRRLDLVIGALIVSALSVLLMFLSMIIMNLKIEEILTYSIFTFSVNLIAGLLVSIFLPILEHIFNLPTTFRLIELTTMNSKTLKRMAVMARGTYSHSVAVADLAESACESIGANHLIARVGAYYHDIGKIDQPEYFIENQTGDNKHDEIKPSLSVVVIKSHVKLGIEKAKAIGLPQEIIDIVAQHHGSDLISYFYREALINSDKDKDKGGRIAPEDFSYNGTPPMTREAGVVMLADSVDAASRTLKQPTTSKIEKLIWKIFMDKIEHRQLVHCDLSLHDLEKIKNSFIIILAGRYHTRIEYPDLPEEAKK